ncbi:hypothetical protein E8E11_009278 [Didymella keratinophila]|nr:hypothetical protein E8E11_009278 [Didymella keratinophila]
MKSAAMKRKTPSTNAGPQDDDSLPPVSNSLVETSNQQRKRRTIDKTEDENVYASCKIDYASTGIRIFTLFPSEDRAAPLEGALRIASLDDQTPAYEALSYVWGDADNKYHLRLGGAFLRLSTNLFIALQQLRCANKPRDLWVDAICINQNTTKEKNHQVQRMFEVYRRAERVLMWLGDADDASEYVLSNMARLSDPRSPALSADEQTKLRAFFGRPWWKRTWTLQEAFAAKPDSLVICGSEATEWDKIYGGLRNLDCHSDSTRVFFNNCGCQSSNKNRLPLLELFWSSMSRSAKDPRDYVYALLGPFNSGRSFALLPDYSKSAKWAYQKTMMAIMAEEGHLDFLVLKLLQCNRTTPSWCLDFSATSHLEVTLSSFIWLESCVSASDKDLPTTSESIHPSSLFQFDEGKSSITLLGWKIDEVWESWADSNCESLSEWHSDLWLQYSKTPTGLAWREKWIQHTKDLDFHRSYETLRDIFPPRYAFGSRGGRVCYANTDVHEGDIICKLYGSLFPLIIRPRKDGSCEMIGIVGPSAELEAQGSAELSWELEYMDREDGIMIQKLEDRKLAEGQKWFVIT